MNKIFLAIFFLVAAASPAFAQAQITTKKEKLKDFTTKITKVVMTGNELQDMALRDAVKGSWVISPFEFCTMDEFKSLRSRDEYYFLVPMKVRYKNETKAGITMLELLRGDTDVKEIDDMLVVTEIPMCPGDAPFTYSAYIPAIIDILQSYVGNSLVRGFKGLRREACPLYKASGKKFYFTDDDLASDFSEADKEKFFTGNMELCGPDEVDEVLSDAMDNALVAYIVAPEEPEKGSVSYKMLIDARTHELYYFKKRKISEASGRGFTRSEVLTFESIANKK